MSIKAIYARAINGVMGLNNTLPWDVPADMRRFKRLTSGCVVVMGYNTWASLGFKALPHRINVVIVDPAMPIPESSHGELFAHSLEEALTLDTKATFWVIGGPALIAQAMRDFDAEVHRTTLGINPKGDVFSHEADRELAAYARVGYEEFNCNDSVCQIVFERLVKAGINAGLK